MKGFSNRNIALDLNLSFNHPPQELLNDEINKSEISLIKSYSHWESQLNSWLIYISLNDCFSHKIIRQSSSFSMGLQFVNDDEIALLNGHWRNKFQKTDVLSFPVLDENISLPVDQSVELGDIVISLTTAQLQAIEHGHSLQLELLWLISHGFLHLLGWEHSDSRKLQEMLSCQEQLLAFSGNVNSFADYELRDH